MEARDGSRKIAPPPVVTCVLDSGQIFRQHIDNLKELQGKPTDVDVATLSLEHAPDESHQEHAMEPGFPAFMPLSQSSESLAIPSASGETV